MRTREKRSYDTSLDEFEVPPMLEKVEHPSVGGSLASDNAISESNNDCAKHI